MNEAHSCTVPVNCFYCGVENQVCIGEHTTEWSRHDYQCRVCQKLVQLEVRLECPSGQ